MVFAGARKSGHLDLEAIEMATRTAAHQLGARVLEKLLSTPAEVERETPCPCGRHARFHQMRSKQVLSVVGPITLLRPYYVCPACGSGQSPRDAELDVQGTEYSPGTR